MDRADSTTTRMRRHRLPVIALLAVALVAAACSGDRGADPSGGVASGNDAAGTTTIVGSGGQGDFGDLTGACGPNEGGGGVPQDAPTEVLGVSEDTITVGTISDPGFEGRPGLNQEVFDAAEAFVDWCNAAGGINGRQLQLNFRDAAGTECQPVVEQSCQEDFAVVGGGAIQDSFWASTGAACGSIDLAGFAVSTEKAGLAGQDARETRTLQAIPNPADQFAVGPFLDGEERTGADPTRSAVLYGDIDSIQAQRDLWVGALEQVGHDFIYDTSYNILGEANWGPFAAAIEQAGIEVLTFLGEGANYALLAQALQEVGYTPDLVLLPGNFYDAEWIEAAGPASKGATVAMTAAPFEDADTNPAIQLYLDLLGDIDGKVGLLGVQAMSSWLLFAQAARDCDRSDDLTRTCVLQGAAAVHDWTGGGLNPPTEPGTNQRTPCYVLMQVTDGAFTRLSPDDGFECGEIVDV